MQRRRRNFLRYFAKNPAKSPEPRTPPPLLKIQISEKGGFSAPVSPDYVSRRSGESEGLPPCSVRSNEGVLRNFAQKSTADKKAQEDALEMINKTPNIVFFVEKHDF